MKQVSLLIIFLFLTAAITGCKNPQITVPSVQSPTSKDSNVEISQDDLDKLNIAYCNEGNCPCGDGFCSQGSYCINDVCFCGAHPEQGYFDDETIASNNYGEFMCVTYEIGCFEDFTDYYPVDPSVFSRKERNQIQRLESYKQICLGVRNQNAISHDFICTRDKGCKTGDGRKFSKFKGIPVSLEEDHTISFDNSWSYGLFREGIDRKMAAEDIALPEDYYFSSYNQYSGFYQVVVRESCGKRLRNTYINSSYNSKNQSLLECELRRACNDIGVTEENISDYLCDVGIYYDAKIDCTSDYNLFGSGYNYQEMPIGLRCMKPKGCTCGNTQCPAYALCKEGACMYDLFYQHRTCPGEGWDNNISDNENYILNHGDFCYDELEKTLNQVFTYRNNLHNQSEVASRVKDCVYSNCYWKIYPSEMTRDDPCITESNMAKDHAQTSEFSDRTPFKFTVSTDLVHKNSVRILVAIEPVDENHPIKYDLDCDGDGKYEYIGLTKNTNCIYPKDSGNHQIWIRGNVPSIQLCKNPSLVNNSESVISVDSWGDIQWQSMNHFAANCKNLEKLPTEAPKLSDVTDMSSMFENALSFNQPIDKWNVSNIKDMSAVFNNAQLFNQPLESWDVSNVTNMRGMFRDAESFNQPLEKWNVSKVTDMSAMFVRANSFNQPIEKWVVSNVTDMSAMFAKAESFNQPLEKWNVSKVTDMSDMFSGTKLFNQPLEKWNVSRVTNMMRMFENTKSFNQPLNRWNVSNVTRMFGMFEDALCFNQPLDNWDVSKVTEMSYMFRNAKSFNQPLDKWNVSNATEMYEIFNGAIDFSHYPSSWIVPEYQIDRMFIGTKVEQLAEKKPLKTR